jgi:ABC-type polysaccharide/polyol phosphate transport system ATPase subunit
MIKDMCNRVLLLHHGRIIVDGSPDEAIARYHQVMQEPQAPQLTVAE